ncbi:MAG: ABC transporter permease subunit [Bacteroidetes bacterium]|nr:ABC transporter permease subunit [Bacteroidota bacterium]
MLRLIIEKELRDIFSSTKFLVTFSICALLILLSFLIGAKNHQIAQAQFEASKRANILQYEGVTDWMRVQEYKIFLPPQPLATLVNGVANDIGRTIEVRGRGELRSQDSRYGDDPIFALFRFLDLEFIFSIVLSLFAVLFGYDLINGEKERGTLRLTFSHALPRTTYITAKFIGAFLALVVPLLIPILAGMLILPLFGIALSGDDWLKLTLIILAGIIAVGAFLALALFVSASTERSSTSFLVLLSLWIVMVMIIPRLSVIGADQIVNVPSVDEINSQKSRFMSQIWNEDRGKMNSYVPPKSQDVQAVMGGFNKFMQELADAREKKFNELSARLNEERLNRQTEQQTLAMFFSGISPSALFTLAAGEINGTSLRMERAFLDQAKEYQRQYAAFMKEKTGMNTGGFSFVVRMVTNDDAAPPKPINISELPQFGFTPLSAASGLAPFAGYAGILAAYMMLFFAGAYRSFNRYDVR